MQFQVGDKLQMKKKHPCGSTVWEVLYAGSDVKIRCTGCGHMVMTERSKLVKNIKAVLEKDK